jgi:transposase-like protein
MLPPEKAIVIVIGHRNPALAALAGHIGVTGVALRFDGVVFLVHPFVGGFARVDGAALSVVQVLAMSDDDAFTLLRRARWGDGDEVVCPHCGLVHRHDFRPTRKIWRCAGCQVDFSVTSGTIFALHKLPLRLYLAAVILFANAVKGISALQVGRDLSVSHKTAYVLLHKIRESLLVGREESALQGEIHVDGAYVGGKVRPENRKKDRVDRRLAENQDPDKRCILVMRQAHTEAEVAAGNAGAKKTLTFIVKNENRPTSANWRRPTSSRGP